MRDDLIEIKVPRLGKRGPIPKDIVAYVDENGCHICTSHPRGAEGHPKITRMNRAYNIARYLWIEKFGDFNGVLCHKCDNASCINLDHVYAGTFKTNVEDIINRRRNAKHLSRSSIHYIRLFKGNTPDYILAKKLACSLMAVNRVKNHRSYING